MPLWCTLVGKYFHPAWDSAAGTPKLPASLFLCLRAAGLLSRTVTEPEKLRGCDFSLCCASVHEGGSLEPTCPKCEMFHLWGAAE